MNYFDIFVLVILAFALIRGLLKGFIIELASLVALVLGIVGAVFLSDITAHWLSNYFTSKYIYIISFVLILVAIIILVFLIARLVDNIVKATPLGLVNRISGGFFAVIKAAFGISLLILVLDFSGFGMKIIPDDTRNSSHTFVFIEMFAPKTFDLINLNYQHLLPQKQEQSPTPVSAPVMI